MNLVDIVLDGNRQAHVLLGAHQFDQQPGKARFAGPGSQRPADQLRHDRHCLLVLGAGPGDRLIEHQGADRYPAAALGTERQAQRRAIGVAIRTIGDDPPAAKAGKVRGLLR